MTEHLNCCSSVDAHALLEVATTPESTTPRQQSDQNMLADREPAIKVTIDRHQRGSIAIVVRRQIGTGLASRCPLRLA